jgi:signal transduction histidine kinase
LTVATGRVELLREKYGDDEDIRALADAHERMETLIDDLLELARSGTRVDDPTTVELTGVLENCARTVGTAGATLSVVDDLTIRADESRLRQLLENLLRNAVDHGITDEAPTSDGARAGVGDDAALAEGADSPAEGLRITVGALEDDSGFYVADDGVGIPPK